MKRLVASRKLLNHCAYCNKSFSKGDVYYKDRKVYKEDNELIAFTVYICPRCKHEKEQHGKRFKKFKDKCTHPKEFIETEYDYIPGECVKEPQYDYCRLCGKTL